MNAHTSSNSGKILLWSTHSQRDLSNISIIAPVSLYFEGSHPNLNASDWLNTNSTEYSTCLPQLNIISTNLFLYIMLLRIFEGKITLDWLAYILKVGYFTTMLLDLNCFILEQIFEAIRPLGPTESNAQLLYRDYGQQPFANYFRLFLKLVFLYLTE